MLDAKFSAFHSAYIQHLGYSIVQARSNSVVEGFSETSEQTYLWCKNPEGKQLI
jgi:hypothetical protein